MYLNENENAMLETIERNPRSGTQTRERQKKRRKERKEETEFKVGAWKEKTVGDHQGEKNESVSKAV